MKGRVVGHEGHRVGGRYIRTPVDGKEREKRGPDHLNGDGMLVVLTRWVKNVVGK